MAERIIEIENQVEASVDGKTVIIKGPKGELRRRFVHPKLELKIKDGKFFVSSKIDKRRPNAIVGTWAAHLRNMMIGVKDGWEAKLKLTCTHFPAKLSVEGKKILIQNFLGKRKQREVEVYGDDTKVDIKKDEIIITGIDKEAVGQTAGRLEKKCKISKFDRRIFQDGIWITQKPTKIESQDGDKK